MMVVSSTLRPNCCRTIELNVRFSIPTQGIPQKIENQITATFSSIVNCRKLEMSNVDRGLNRWAH